jgi:predicted RNA-binding protein with PIN domain
VAFIVDGNNVMGQTPGWHRDKSAARRQLVEQLADFARLKKTRVTVVFDGAPDAHIPDGSSYRGVRVRYAERGSDADAVVERLVFESTDRRGLVVVTSDRQLAAECRSLGASVERSGDFRKRMAGTAAAAATRLPDPGAAERPAAGSVDEWLRYFGCDGDEE